MIKSVNLLSVLSLSSLIALGSCSMYGSSPKPKLPGWPDSAFGENMQTGKDMIDMKHPRLARSVYQDAVDKAKEANDQVQLSQAYYNLGISDLLANDLIEFDKDMAQGDKDLSKFNDSRDYRLDLLKAAAQTKKGNAQQAIDLANTVLGTPDIPRAFRTQATFLKGVNYTSLQNSEEAHSAYSSLSSLSSTPFEKNNELELKVRLELLDGSNTAALTDSKKLVNLRRQEQNFTSMQEALVLEMRATQATGGSEEQIKRLEQQMEQSKAAEKKLDASY